MSDTYRFGCCGYILICLEIVDGSLNNLNDFKINLHILNNKFFKIDFFFFY